MCGVSLSFMILQHLLATINFECFIKLCHVELDTLGIAFNSESLYGYSEVLCDCASSCTAEAPSVGAFDWVAIWRPKLLSVLTSATNSLILLATLLYPGSSSLLKRQRSLWWAKIVSVISPGKPMNADLLGTTG